MYKCVTSKHCCEISNLIHEEWRSENGLLQAVFKKKKKGGRGMIALNAFYSPLREQWVWQKLGKTSTDKGR